MEKEYEKKLLATGKRHLNNANKIVGPRVVGEDCKCKYKCFEKFDEQERKRILSNFNKIGEKVMQDTYLCGLISSSAVVRNRLKTGNGRKRNVSHKYKVILNKIHFRRDSFYVPDIVLFSDSCRPERK